MCKYNLLVTEYNFWGVTYSRLMPLNKGEWFIMLNSKNINEAMPMSVIIMSIKSISMQCPPEIVAGGFCSAAVETRAGQWGCRQSIPRSSHRDVSHSDHQLPHTPGRVRTEREEGERVVRGEDGGKTQSEERTRATVIGRSKLGWVRCLATTPLPLQ